MIDDVQWFVGIDWADVRSGRRLPPIHPGEILRDEFLTPMGISVYELLWFRRTNSEFCTPLADKLVGLEIYITDDQ